MATTYAIPNGRTVMAATLWTGAGQTGAGSITGVGFQPDFVWAKARTFTSSNALYNSIVGGGANTGLSSDLTSSEAAFNDNATNGYLSSFDSNGFSYFGGSTPGYFSANTQTYVAWSWNAGGSTVTNTSGSISAQVRANPTAGFSIVTYTGTGVNATVGHGLGVAPKMVIVKQRSGIASTYSWCVYHSSLTSAAYFVQLNATTGQASDASVWNSTAPTSSVFSIGTTAGTNASTGTFVAYCWAEVPGYSKFGIYDGNNATDGPFVYLGFRPRFILMKATTGSFNWNIFDSSRDSYNTPGTYLFANSATNEGTTSYIDFLSNGFKLRNAGTALNGPSTSYIYAAFAENPFKYANAR